MNGFLQWLIHGDRPPKTAAERRQEKREALERQISILRAGPTYYRSATPHEPRLAEELELALGELTADPAYRRADDWSARQAALTALFDPVEPLADLHDRLAGLPWDGRGDGAATLTGGHIRRALGRWRAGEIDACWLQQWACLIDARGDVGFEDGDTGAVRDALHALADPSLYGDLTPALADDMEAGLPGDDGQDSTSY